MNEKEENESVLKKMGAHQSETDSRTGGGRPLLVNRQKELCQFFSYYNSLLVL